MIDSRFDSLTGTGSFVLAPNRSLSWAGNRTFLTYTSAGMLTLAVVLAWMGLWPILVVTVLELAMLWGVFYAVALRQLTQECLTLTETEIILQAGRRGPEQEMRFPRPWTRLEVREGPSHWYLKRLFLRCCGREAELASALNADEREALAAQLRRVISA